MKRTTFEECLRIKSLLERLKEEFDLSRFGVNNLLIKVKELTGIDIGYKLIRSILLTIGVEIKRQPSKLKEGYKKEINLLKEEIDNQRKLIEDFKKVINGLKLDLNEFKNHAFASRQYVCDLAEQLGVTFEHHNKSLSNSRH